MSACSLSFTMKPIFAKFMWKCYYLHFPQHKQKEKKICTDFIKQCVEAPVQARTAHGKLSSIDTKQNSNNKHNLLQFGVPVVLDPSYSAPFLSTHQHCFGLWLLHCVGIKNPSSSHFGVNIPGNGCGSPLNIIVGIFFMARVHGGAVKSLRKMRFSYFFKKISEKTKNDFIK